MTKPKKANPRAARFEELHEHARKLAETFPPLSEETKDWLRPLLRPVLGVIRASMSAGSDPLPSTGLMIERKAVHDPRVEPVQDPGEPTPRVRIAPMGQCDIWYDGVMTVMIELDTRRRASLGSLAQADRYLVDVDEATGVITMQPAVVMTETEARLLGRNDILDAVAVSRHLGVDAGRPVRRST